MMGGGIIGVLLIAVIIWLIFQYNSKGGINNPFNNKKTDEHSEESSLEILKIRYAKGEITKDQFNQMKKNLE